jgi:hypothetical protein
MHRKCQRYQAPLLLNVYLDSFTVSRSTPCQPKNWAGALLIIFFPVVFIKAYTNVRSRLSSATTGTVVCSQRDPGLSGHANFVRRHSRFL